MGGFSLWLLLTVAHCEETERLVEEWSYTFSGLSLLCQTPSLPVLSQRLQLKTTAFHEFLTQDFCRNS